MRSTLLKVSAVLISLGSFVFGVYWVWVLVTSRSPDRSIYVAPLLFFGLPLTIVGQVVSFGLMMAGGDVGVFTSPIIICYFFQWQYVAWWLYRRGVSKEANYEG